MTSKHSDIHGSSLQDIIDEEKEVDETHGLVVDILKGVAYLHEVGVVHGDIKPANIFVSSNLNVAKLYVISVLVVYGNMRQ